MKSFSKLVVAVGVATSLTMTAPAYAQSSDSNNTTTQTSSAGTIGALVGAAVAGVGAAAATQGPAPLVDMAKVTEAFTSPAMVPYAVAFTMGLLGVGATIGTLIGNAVG